MNELVSIITPVYNAEKYVAKTVESVLHQQYKNWELILIDDCSKDNSFNIITEYSKKHKKIKVYRMEKNAGVSNARNLGLTKAKGKYIAFLDSDDIWLPNKLSVQINYMAKNSCFFTFSNHGYVNDGNEISNKIYKVPSIVNYKTLLSENVIHCLTVVINRNEINNIKMPNVRHEDYATWLNILKSGYCAYGIDENLALYRKSTKSLTSNKFRSMVWRWNIYRKQEKLSLFKSCYYIILYLIKVLI